MKKTRQKRNEVKPKLKNNCIFMQNALALNKNKTKTKTKIE